MLASQSSPTREGRGKEEKRKVGIRGREVSAHRNVGTAAAGRQDWVVEGSGGAAGGVGTGTGANMGRGPFTYDVDDVDTALLLAAAEEAERGMEGRAPPMKDAGHGAFSSDVPAREIWEQASTRRLLGEEEEAGCAVHEDFYTVG